MPFVAAGLRRRGDDGAGGLLIFRLEVLADDPVLLDSTPRERVALACILACHPASGQVVLQARPVDEDVDCIRALTPCGERARHAVDPIVRDRYAGSQRS